ncbi:ATP-binding protein [Streptomyces sp. OF3]|uniref:ATP-binding protein n=1 Tax=Streptomyces alkaliterrae TaxID=2213162 RepID=A0A7W3ZT83_9ACTN|nr:ATP-binding protein [Streptomyces alkaliterrae]MBB1253396.1 ATP-binding protein [Streptomyces alkaliterrae]MBB1260019.1 ATP-binding protein [Streptomyces alkaliterrae]
MSIWWSLHLRREAASVPLARRLLLGTMETAGVDEDIAYELSLALSEACANAVEHGGASDRRTDQYRVTAFLDGDMCRIEVADHGPGFPAPASPHPAETRRAAPVDTESGRGLHLIEALSDHARFRNRPGDGAVVSFDKILKWREDALLKVS